MNLEGQVAIVTGASRGIGRVTALALAQAGADVVCAARTTDADDGEVTKGATGYGVRLLTELVTAFERPDRAE